MRGHGLMRETSLLHFPLGASCSDVGYKEIGNFLSGRWRILLREKSAILGMFLDKTFQNKSAFL